ncbi:MAG: FlgO family outer membrane protein [Alphaproteobacteria bacterium]
MRAKIIVGLTIAIGMNVAFTTGVASAQSYETNLKSIATNLVAKLEEANKRSSTVLDFTDLQGSPTELGRFLAQELSDQLVSGSKKVSFVDRANLQVLLREHKLSVEGLVNPESIAKIGNLVGIDTIIVGTTTAMGDTIRLSVRAIDVETGKIVVSQATNLPATSGLMALSNRGVESASPDLGPSAETGAATDSTGKKAREKGPGWLVQLRTATFPNWARMDMNPGNIAAYIEKGPSFLEETFVKEAGLSQSSQAIGGKASSKFVARTAGAYQFGLRIEVPDVGCYEKFTVNGTVLSDRKADVNNVSVFVFPVKLAPGSYDTTLDFGCEHYGRQVTAGKITILVAHPGELAPQPARQGDFVHSGAGED